MIKRVIFFKRKSGMSRDEFKKYWINEHAQVVKTFPGLVRYVVNYFANQSEDDLMYDGFAELWYENEEALKKLSASEFVKDFVKVDLPKFQDMQSRWDVMIEEYAIK